MNDSASVVFRDMLFGALAAIIVVLIFLINPPDRKNEAELPGNLVVSIFWPEGSIDVDLWLTAPGEPAPVGFSNKDGRVWNLLRDDLGLTADLVPLNFENAYSRGMPVGRYTVNVFCFRCTVGPFDVIVKIERKKEDGSLVIVKEGTITLSYTREEKTFLNFNVNGEGKIVNLNQVQRKLFLP